ncbi:glycosyltransferase family 69 protein [Conidiobolus coronatus NRRL 28638]|uniref:Glycosyltransferase family 69 protein n=1 Tax=Conidiobolus coronatus (strain ATCC 28846 / CBS 209.66 / NRRL 28638) TaxID=796925 RepID=A0A137NTW3_CONC2|nr:glycosyltransferase family 69 protein [Conidiobolus coronatus NRRL 28638]|eukprot:KXN66179.1 glycosyltransferase family 69 protein [Conidiobolus coronatus NRRL 28638]
MRIINNIVTRIKNFRFNTEYNYQPLAIPKVDIKPLLISICTLCTLAASIYLIPTYGSLPTIIQATILLKTSLLLAPLLLILNCLKLSKKLKYIGYFLIFINVFLYWNSNQNAYFHNRARQANVNTGKTQAPKFYLAANLYQNEPTIPYWKDEIVRLSKYLGPDNMYISIVENFSTDDTKVQLREFDQELEKLGIQHTIELGYNEFTSKREIHGDDRIISLKNVRNRVMEPLFRLKKQGKEYDYIIFINDIFFIAEDIIELINSNQGNYDMVCSLDFMGRLYDLWVLRDSRGIMPSFYFPYFKTKEDKDKLYNKELVEVYSCWNGVVSINTKVIYENWNYPDNKGSNLVDFRARKFNYTITDNFIDPSQECYSSECFLIFYDLRHKLSDLGRKLKAYVNPKVTVTYEKLVYMRWKETFNNWFYRYHNYFYDTTNPDANFGVADNHNKEYECMLIYG